MIEVPSSGKRIPKFAKVRFSFDSRGSGDPWATLSDDKVGEAEKSVMTDETPEFKKEMEDLKKRNYDTWKKRISFKFKQKKIAQPSLKLQRKIDESNARLAKTEKEARADLESRRVAME